MTAAVADNRASIDEAAEIAVKVLGEPARALARIGGGRNSQVYRVDLKNDRRVVLKRYFQHAQDNRDRRLTEATALCFMHEHGVTSVPRLLCSDAHLQVSVLEFVEGAPINATDATPSDMQNLATFLVDLHRLTTQPAAMQLPRASEAMFTLEDLVESISVRLRRLRQVERKTPRQRELACFLVDSFEPALANASMWASEELGRHGWQADDPLPLAARTLSPSDFGLHNALQQADGRLVFVDFEYFGQDDPAKTISDFLLHPGMALSLEQRGLFLRALLTGLPRDHALEDRVRVAYVLYALKWVMILLNEFVPEHLARRLFANPSLRADEVQDAQMAKARAMLAQSLQAQIEFPYASWMVP